MMNFTTISLAASLVVALLIAAPATPAQETRKVFRVGFLSTTLPRSAPPFAAFEKRMRELGYTDGQGYIFEFRTAEGQADRLPKLAAELVDLGVDVIVAPGPEATLAAARHATGSIPIVMMAVNYDPLVKGYIESLARPGGNTTGVVFQQVQLSAKRLELLREAVPHLTRVFALYDSHSAAQLKESETIAKSLGIELRALELRNPPYDFAGAVDTAVKQKAQALLILSSPIFYRQRNELIEATVRNALPAMFLFRPYVQAGGLLAYGVNLQAMYQQGADYVHRILNGAKPGELPVERPREFELVINLKTAKALGLDMPGLLYRANKVIR